jgi:L-ascorbate metabolism protein UlaG (beta-lactamase superfamily)
MEQALALIFWLGQSCFVIQAGDTTILTDPFNAQVGYEVPRVEGVDVVTISHEHGDHNNAAMAVGSPVVLRGLAGGGAQFNRVDQKIKNVRVFSVNAYHDDESGAKRGKNAIFVFEISPAGPPLRIVHAGDLGQKRLDPAQIKEIGSVDVLLLPVGGYYTIGSAEANQVLADLKPKIVVPMHWKTGKTPKLPIQSDAPFLEGKKHILRDGAVSGNRLVVTASLLKQAQEAGEPLIAPLEFGPAPASHAKGD